jgi:putative flippase GtrA
LTFLRYVAVQVIAYGVDLGVFFALVLAGLATPPFANAASKCAAGVFAFLVHRVFTFGLTTPEGRGVAALRYFALLALNAPLSSLLLVGVLHFLTNVAAGKVVSDCMSVGVTFLLTRWFVFPPSRMPARAGHAAPRRGDE